MVSVNIAKAKAELSKYIKIAQSGEEVIITDHKVPAAKLVVVEEGPRPKLVITEATRSTSDLKYLKLPSPIPDLDVVALIREDRDAR